MTLTCRTRLQAQATADLVQAEQGRATQRQAKIAQQQHKAQHAKRAAAAVVRKVPQQAQQKRLTQLKELQDLVDQRYCALQWLQDIGILTCHAYPMFSDACVQPR